MFHHGVKNVVHNSHVNDIKHNDVIVVVGHKDGPREAPPISTHASHYVKHPIESRSVPPPRVPPTPTRFEGKTSYDADFVKHPLEPRSQQKPPASRWANRKADAPMAKSTYSQHYPWHEVQQPQQVPSAPVHRPSAPFDGQTSYSNDFVKHPFEQRTPPKEVPRPAPGPFEGSSTYNNDFQKHPPQMNKPIPTQSTLRPSTGPFNGTTEYAQEYLKHEHEKPRIVHLEPELRRERQSRPHSAPGSRERQSRPHSGSGGTR